MDADRSGVSSSTSAYFRLLRNAAVLRSRFVVDNVHNQRPPIERLPVEILSHIFCLTGLTRTLTPLGWRKLFLVCRLWYRVATSTPTLWNRICFAPCCSALRSLQLSLKWSKEAPLFLSLYFLHFALHDAGTDYLQMLGLSLDVEMERSEGDREVTGIACMSEGRAACLAIQPHLDRICSLVYFGPLELFFPLSNASSMRRLRIADCRPDSLQEIPRIASVFHQPPPQLRDLDLHNTTPVDNVFAHLHATTFRHFV